MLFELKPASVRSQAGEVLKPAAEYSRMTRGNIKEFEFVFGKEHKALFKPATPKSRKFLCIKKLLCNYSVLKS